MLKPAGARCNMTCAYCYYLEKAQLYRDEARHTLSDELLERFTRDYIEAQTMHEVLFTWHGGEAFMRPLSFYRKAVELQRRYARGRRIDNCIQTNATLITEEWCRFLHDNRWLVGVSIDGPQEFHDEYRRTATGRPSFHKVMQGIRLLNRYGVEWNAMAVVNDFNADYPLDFYHFFKKIGCRYIQFTPIVERLVVDKATGKKRLATTADAAQDAVMAEYSVDSEQWGHFLCAIFDEWVRRDVGSVFIQLFDSTLANWTGAQPGVCTMAAYCGHAAVMEFNGDVYSCDHFVFPQYRLGNIRERTLTEMLYSTEQQTFGAMKKDSLTRQCRECEYLFACNGECPKNRFTTSVYGEQGHNYLCAGYKRFFRHVAPYMDFMKGELDAGRPPANVMQAIREGRFGRE